MSNAAPSEEPTTNSNASNQVRPPGQTPPGAPPAELPPREKIEAVVSEGGVVGEKKGLGRKFKSLFSRVEAKNAANYVLMDVMWPAARSMGADMVAKFGERLFYPDSPAPGRRIYGPTMGSSRPTSYPMGGYRPPATRPPSGRPIETHTTDQRPNTEFILAHRGEAENVVARMGELFDVYQVVTVADLYDLIGIGSQSVHTDNRWGWTTLRGVHVRGVRDGYSITLPPPEPVNY